MKCRPLTLCCLVVVLSSSLAPAQQTPALAPAPVPAPAPTPAIAPAPAATDLPILSNRPDAAAVPAEGSDLLGPRFSNQAAGISLRGLNGAKELRGGAGSDVIVEFNHEAMGWVLTVTKATLRTGRALKDSADGRQIGMLSATVNDFKQMHGDAEVLRQEVLDGADGEVGICALRYLQGTHRRLQQQAVFPASEQLYYTVSLISPAGNAKGLPDDPAKTDPGERRAAEFFRQVVDSVKLLDRTSIRKDQEARLMHTRSFLDVLHEAGTLKKAIVPEQYARLVRDGKDIGYTCTFETATARDTRPGVLISMRARTVPEAGTVGVVTSQMFVSYDWRNESWHHIGNSKSEKRSTQNTELGVSNVASRLVVERDATPATSPSVEPTRATVREEEEYTLEVRTDAKVTVTGRPAQSMSGTPLKKTLPPWYLPQAAQKMLPRLLPLDKPQTYFFYTYVSDRREVMARYVDVVAAEDVFFAGKRVRAIQIYDKVGWDGPPTIHYVNADGQYLGNTTTYTGATPAATTTVQVIPTTPADIKRIWPDADLSKPSGSEFERGEQPAGGK